MQRLFIYPDTQKGSLRILTDEGDFFAGDTLVSSRKPDIATFVDGFQGLDNSAGKLKKLNVKMVYPGHGKAFLSEKLAYELKDN
jgi:glyoxylase-like metal-dependent hydrolase (beta-lactamase superfamily II)